MACQRTESILKLTEPDRRSIPTSSEKAPVQTIARGLALALGEPSISARLRTALRRSPYNEHKILLREYLDSEQGFPLLREASTRTGLTPGQFLDLVRMLPAMDSMRSATRRAR